MVDSQGATVDLFVCHDLSGWYEGELFVGDLPSDASRRSHLVPLGSDEYKRAIDLLKEAVERYRERRVDVHALPYCACTKMIVDLSVRLKTASLDGE
ncbi:MAG: hypothetical protein R3E01_27385 [Pirellulaceae bacterium]